MFPLNIRDQQYVLSLDKLDISFLSQYINRSSTEKRVLWSNQLIDGESVYCKIHIPTDDFEDENSYIESSVFSMCHICNIDVPQQYYKQHIRSEFHQTYKKLSEKMLENVSKQMNIIFDCTNDNDQSNEYYCESCAKVVLMEHKQKHNRSKYHLKCIDIHKLADNFVEMYFENKDLKTENKSFNNNTIKNENNANNNFKAMLEAGSNSDSDTDWNFETESEDEENDDHIMPINRVITYTPEAPIITNWENVETKKADDNQVIPIHKTPEMPCNTESLKSLEAKPQNVTKEGSQFELYLKNMMTKYKLKFNIPTIENNSIVITTPSGFKENIAIDVFHSYKKINSFIFCQLCKERVGPDTSYHSSTKCHVMNIMQPVDNNFLRELIGSKKWSHCLVCNDIVMSDAIHFSTFHKKYYERKQSQSNKVLVENSNILAKMTFCDICKIHLDPFDFSTHLKEKSHVNLLNSLLNTGSSVAAGSNSTFIQKENVRPGPSNVLLKDDMNIGIVANYPENGCTNRVNRNLKESTESNKSTVSDNKTAQHNLPNSSKTLPDIAKTKTINDLTDQEKLIEYNKQLAEFDEYSVECLVCDLKVPFCNRNMIEHIEGFRHKKAVEVLLSEHKILRKSYNLYDCTICNKSFDDFVDHIQVNLLHRFRKACMTYFEDSL